MDSNKKNVVLLGDGFFARGFLHNINRNKFNITQIYKDEFINPQDIMYSFERQRPYKKAFHFRDLIDKLFKPSYIKIKEEIKTMEINNKNVDINNKNYDFDYLVIGLGSNKSLADWTKDINDIYYTLNKKLNGTYNIIGMGPVGLEIANILSQKKEPKKEPIFNESEYIINLGFGGLTINNIFYKQKMVFRENNFINFYDILNKNDVFNYVSPKSKQLILDNLEKGKIKTIFGKSYEYHNDDINLYCIGNAPNKLTNNFYPNKYLKISENVYIGGDCNITNKIKSGQIAYQQGVYVARQLNGETDEQFKYNHHGTAFHMGNKKVLIDGHKYLPDRVYPDFFVKFYSVFFI